MKNYIELQQKTPDGQKDNKRSKRVVRVCLLIAIILLILLLLRCCGNHEKTDGDSFHSNTVEIRQGSIDDEALVGMTDEEIVAELNRKVEESMITMTINPEPAFREGSGNLLIYNDESNHGPVVVEIQRNDTKELIYTSPVIPLGKRVNNASLDVELPVGDYPCTAYFHYVDAAGEILGTGGVSITVHIETKNI